MNNYIFVLIIQVHIKELNTLELVLRRHWQQKLSYRYPLIGRQSNKDCWAGNAAIVMPKANQKRYFKNGERKYLTLGIAHDDIHRFCDTPLHAQKSRLGLIFLLPGNVRGFII